jgi:hypothetical protein
MLVRVGCRAASYCRSDVNRKFVDPAQLLIGASRVDETPPACWLLRRLVETGRTRIFLFSLVMLATSLQISAQDKTREMTASRTVFILVDESATLRADREGWRQEAIALFAYALPNGSSVALSGFGNPERRIALDLSRLDDTDAGQIARRRIAERAKSLSSDDKYTDLYGAIQQVISKVGAMDKGVLRAAPPALILLTDFEADPKPDHAMTESVCRGIRESGIELIAIGFGKVNAAAQSYIAGCADTLPVATLKDPGDLVDTFWKISRRLSRYIRVRAMLLTPSTPVQVTLPDWASEAAVLAFAPGSPVSDWQWDISGVPDAASGRYFRLRRVPVKKERHLSIAIAGTRPVQLSVAVRGDAVLSLTSRTPEPWLRGEAIPFDVQLRAASSEKLVDEWVSIGEVDHAAWVRVDDQQPSPMEFDPAHATFTAPMLLSQAGSHRFTSTVLIDGTVWRAETGAAIQPFPVLKSGGTLRTWAWVPGRANLKLKTGLDARVFEASYTASANLGHAQGVAKFGPTTATQTISVWTGSSSGSLARNWFRPLDPITGTLQLDIHLQNGQTVGGFETPIVITFSPLWARLAIVAVPLLLLLTALRGRQLPPWHLLRLDTSWKPIPGDVIRLRAHRRRIDLGRYGLPGTEIRRPIIGKTFVQLGKDTGVCVKGNRDLRYNLSNKSIHPGDVISRRDSAGTETSFRVVEL